MPGREPLTPRAAALTAPRPVEVELTTPASAGDRVALEAPPLVGASSARPDGHSARHLLGLSDLRLLLSVRMFGQFADGVFQASLAGAVLFNPEHQAKAADVAAGFAVLLLPYSFLGPFAGVLIDRWWRQRVLVGANLLRALLVCGVALEIAGGVDGQLFYLSALLVISVNRFVLSALSASLPHVIDPGRLVTANALSTTAGAIVTAIGGGAAIGLRTLGGGGNTGTAVVASGAAIAYLAAGTRARRFSLTELGPDDDTRCSRESVRNVVAGLVAGAQHVRDQPVVVRAFLVISVHRFAYGITTITTLLLYRNYFHQDGFFRAGLGGLAQVVTAIAVGGGLAALVTPWASRRFGFVKWSGGLLVFAGITEWLLGVPFQQETYLPAAAILGFVGQGIKICVDTLVAQRIADDYRGRVFSLYDTLFNLLFVSAAVVTALLLPENGKSVIAVIVIGAAYVVVGLAYFYSRDLDTKPVSEADCDTASRPMTVSRRWRRTSA